MGSRSWNIPIALVGCAAAIAAWLTGAGRLSLAAAVLLGSAVSFALIVMKPVNDALLQGGDVSVAFSALPAKPIG
jgi:hypothetical protein